MRGMWRSPEEERRRHLGKGPGVNVTMVPREEETHRGPRATQPVTVHAALWSKTDCLDWCMCVCVHVRCGDGEVGACV